MQAESVNLFLLNAYGHYFEMNMAEATLDKSHLRDCQIFDNKPALMSAVCAATGCDLEDVEGSIFYITMRNGEPVMIDDRGFAQAINGAVEEFIAGFVL